MAKKNNKITGVPEEEFTPIEEETSDVVEEEFTSIEEETSEVVEENEIEPITMTGTVTTRLNIREDSTGDPNVKIVSIVEAGSTLTLYPDDSTPVFWKVKTVSGVEGYAMRRYIIIDAEIE